MALKKIIQWLRSFAECDHRFKSEDVSDLNIDPRCIHCNHYFSKISTGRLLKFEKADDKTHKLVQR